MPVDTSIPIIDAHHHYWDPIANYHPWLRDEPMVPFRYGDYSSIRSRFMPAEYAALTQRFNIVATVTIEGEWDETDQVGESRWMQSVADQQGAPAAHVARTFLDSPGAIDEIAQHAAYPIVKGIRHKPAAAAAPSRVEIGAPGSMSDPNWQRGYAALAPNNLHFELQTPWWHVRELMDLIDAFPDTPVVINHAFMPVDRSPEGLSAWRDAIRLASTAPSVSMKISGIGISGKRWALADQLAVIEACIDAFGPERSMFASNFPVDGLIGSFDAIYDGFLTVSEGYSRRDQVAMFHDNAIRVYRLGITPAAGS